jgi:hypothetical protein
MKRIKCKKKDHNIKQTLTSNQFLTHFKIYYIIFVLTSDPRINMG